MSNKNIIQKCANHADRVEEILKPLSNIYGIDNLFYAELLPKHEKAMFISNKYSTVEKLMNIGHFSEQHNKFISEISITSGCHKFIWPQDPSNLDEVGTMLKDTGIKSGMSFIYSTGDTIKNIGFASTNYSDELLNMFVNKNELFHHFIKYFENEAKDILQDSTQLLMDFKSASENSLSNLQNNKLKECVNSMEIKKLYITNREGENITYLTRREYECLFLLCKGNSMKQIAHILKLSPRTVEEYLITCKTKFGVYNKFELVNRALLMEIDKLAIINEDQ
jgi:DNA-binding CsgD family transcriptional regulator